MALAFLSKKSFHTTNLDNVERVWIAEQKEEAERKKLSGSWSFVNYFWAFFLTFYLEDEISSFRIQISNISLFLYYCFNCLLSWTELQKQIEDERQIQELRQLQVASGQKVKTTDSSLDWMYQGPHASQMEKQKQSEDYLLGIYVHCLILFTDALCELF